MGGHSVPVVDIRGRFRRSLAHLVDDYLALAERWIIWDNTTTSQGPCLFQHPHYFRNPSNLVNESAFIARGLRAHKAATRTIEATERQMGIRRDPTIISAIRDKAVLKFIYNREPRLVEPQTYGLSTTGKEILRAHQISGGSRAGRSRMAKLFDLAKISGLEKTAQRFAQALPEHNPHDSAMVEIFATLPARKN